MSKQRRNKEQARRRKREKLSTQRAGRSDHRKIGERGDLVGCHVNRRWRESGLATVFVLRRIPGGALAMATFLIDIWCMGLKDAWGRMSITMAEFEDILDSQRSLDFVEIDFDTARQLIEGSIRFAMENGFRLPRRHDRWVNLAGVFGDHANADLQHFKRDGYLVYMGSIEDLRRRLIGSSVEEFLDRDDVRFAVPIDDEHVIGDSKVIVEEMMEWEEAGAELDQLESDEIEASEREEDHHEEILEASRRQIVHGIRRWCLAQGIEPHAMLEQAWDLHELALSEAPIDDPSPIEVNTIRSSVDALLEMRPPREREPLAAAVEQIKRFVSNFESEDEIFAAIGPDRGPAAFGDGPAQRSRARS